MAQGIGTLILTYKGKDQEFEKTHAERLLKRQEDKGYSHWQIKDNKKYQYKDGSIVRTTNSSTPKKA